MNSARTNTTSHRYADLIVLLILSGVVICYAVDAYRASTHIINLIFILPVSALILVLCLMEFVSRTWSEADEAERMEPISAAMPVIALFSGYVLTLSLLGFDIGTFVFVGLFLLLNGERRLPWLVGYSLSFALLASWFFTAMLPYPLPMSILPTEY